ncbi:MAG: hypothetical protein EA401_01160 [Planctomycetota bacterium]|nr:MAG: hypothetical protein EA401_01160 [Planctomycetota bacterium]
MSREQLIDPWGRAFAAVENIWRHYQPRASAIPFISWPQLLHYSYLYIASSALLDSAIGGIG